MEQFPSFKNLLGGKILKVSELNSRISGIIENEFENRFLWIEGEISNFRGNYSSGHWYFSLKDEQSQISAVCFKQANQHIKFIPEDGQELICCGQISVYEKQGTYQIIVRYIEPKGVGAQTLALEQLKEKLKSEGLFDKERKRQIPFLTRKIGVVTSPTGAAIKDILRVIKQKFPNIEMIISPARVQGESASPEIVMALELLYRIKDIDLIIIARGGGSAEDLWVFNEEPVARAISKSPVPTISAVGHEIDITIADLVADLRAATPTMAAEIAVRDKNELLHDLKTLSKRLNNSLNNCLRIIVSDLEQIRSRMIWNLKTKYDQNQSQLKILSGKLDSISPLKVLHRGYSVVYDSDGKRVIKSAKSLKQGDSISIRFYKGRADCTVDKVKN